MLAIFDLDGVLIDSFTASFLSFKEAFALQRVELSEGEFLTFIWGRPLSEWEPIYRGKIKDFDKLRKDKNRIFPGKLGHLRINRGLANLALTLIRDDSNDVVIATSSHHASAKMKLDWMASQGYPMSSLYYEKYTSLKKDRDFFRGIQEVYNAHCQNVVVFEDNDEILKFASEVGQIPVKVLPW